ncbi:MAG: hypothetical protein JST53_14070 [Actinobacteria bacterium]|nr:hypothetical protein [Actinomycetota bacterium]
MVALAALALALPGSARAAFGVEAGSYLAKAHAPVPMLTVAGGNPLLQRRIDVEAIRAADPITQAGAHPDATASFAFNVDTAGEPEGNAKDAYVELPPGFVGDPQAVPACSRQTFALIGSLCPSASQVGVATVHIIGSGEIETLPLYNLVATFGQPASFGFKVSGKPILLGPRLRSDGDYGLTVEASDISDFYELVGSTVTLWGVPADPVHDSERWNPALSAINEFGQPFAGDWGGTSGESARPFLSNPSWCDSGPLDTVLRIASWQEPGRRLPEDPADPAYNSLSPAPTGCGALRFGGTGAPVGLTMQPAVRTADTPSGYEARLTLPYNENPKGLASPTLRDTTVVLPEGVVANPASANGLAACTAGQIGYLGSNFPLPNPVRFSEEAARCPDASKIGTVTIHTPLLAKPLEGSVFLAKQFENPFDSLLAIYLAVDDPETGIAIKLAGEVEPDPLSGQLTATFSDNPQLPFTELVLSFFGGPGASLANAPTCGTKTTASVLTPWSAPSTPAVSTTDSFQVAAGPNGATCAATEAALPAKASFEAGAVAPIAGSYTPFVIKVGREDGTQRLRSLDVTLPEGMTGRLAGTPYCSDPAIARAESRVRPGEGAAEVADPSCPAASQVGTVAVAAGAGPVPVRVEGRAYLAGPYKGAPLSLAVIVPAIAGPFDLGTVVVRTPLHVDEETARIAANSDPFPTILHGIPLDVRSIAIELDKPEFTYTPSSCEAASVDGTATTASGAGIPLRSRFQVGGCSGLRFDPRVLMRVSGPTRRAGYPRLQVTVEGKQGEADISRASVILPRSEFLAQEHIGTVCTRVQYHEGSVPGEKCPAASIYGHARVSTPLLDEPLEGPVVLRSNGGERRLPDLVASLHGQIDISLVGYIDSVHGRIRTRFQHVPDAPISKFSLTMKGGGKSLLRNSASLCRGKHLAAARFVGHNGAERELRVGLQARCGKRARRS